MTTRPVREKRPIDAPRARKFMRGCAWCGCDFARVDGGASERGLWRDGHWYCSIECFPAVET